MGLVGAAAPGGAIQLGGVAARPTTALAVRFGEMTVIGHPGQWPGRVRAMRDLEPVPGAGGMLRHPEAQPLLARDFGPGADDILLGADPTEFHGW